MYDDGSLPCFKARPCGNDVLPEYRQPLEHVVIHPDLMHHSVIHTALSNLPQPPKVKFHSLLINVIAWAFSDNNKISVTQSYFSVPQYDYSGNLFKDVMNLYDSLSSEKRPMKSCIAILYKHKDDILASLLGLLGRSSMECNARKRMAFSTLIHTTTRYLSGYTAGIPIQPGQHSDKNNSLVLHFAMNFLEDWKERAFRSAFLEPTIMYFRLVYDRVQEGDADVHGSNYYVALLDATTGIRLPRLPLWDDEGVKGVAEFHDARLGNILSELQSMVNFGKGSWALMRRLQTNRVESVQDGTFLFNFPGEDISPLEMAKRATDPRDEFSGERMLYSTYLNTFTKYFKAENMLVPLFQAATSDEVVFAALKTVFRDIKDSNSSPVPIDCEDVMDWVWDLEADEVKANLNAIQLLFSKFGITKEP